MKSPTG